MLVGPNKHRSASSITAPASTSSDSTSSALVSSVTVSASTALAVSVLLGLNQADIVGRTFNEIVDTVLPLGETQDDLVDILRSHEAVDVDAVGIHWENHLDGDETNSVPRMNSSGETNRVPRDSRACFYITHHY